MSGKRQKAKREKLDRLGHTGSAPNQHRRRVVATLYQSGLSMRDIAAIVGVSFQAVQSLCKRMGLPVRPPGGNQGAHSRHER